MAKMKVHELAKELDKQSKELIAFLQEKGIDVKAAQSSIEEEAAALVRTHFKKNKPEAPEKKEEKTEKMEMKEEKPMTKEGGAGNEAPKKKKKIIFVSNPHNSKMPGQKPKPAGDKKPQAASGQRQGNYGRQDKQEKMAPYRPVKPLTPPSPTPPVTMVPAHNNMPKRDQKPAAKTENRRPEPAPEVKASRPEQTAGTPVASREQEQAKRPDHFRPERQERPERSGRPEGQTEKRGTAAAAGKQRRE